MQQLYERFREQAAVVFVYVAEAHAADEWQMQANLEEGVLIAQHTTLQERLAAARHGVQRLKLTMPVLVDRMDDAVSEAFAAWPERIYVVDETRRIAFIGGPGPWEFDPDEAALALQALLE